MKLLRISIYCLLLVLLLGSGDLKGQSLATRLGVYQFTDATASEFYSYAPILLADYDVWRRSQLSLQLTSGLAYSQIRYNNHYHYLYMVPLLVSVNYDLPNPGARIYPVVGMGLTFIEKIDRNRSLSKTHHSFAGGYHLTGRLVYKLKENVSLTFDLTYNLMIPIASEELNINGVIVGVGICLPLKHSCSKTTLQP